MQTYKKAFEETLDYEKAVQLAYLDSDPQKWKYTKLDTIDALFRAEKRNTKYIQQLNDYMDSINFRFFQFKNLTEQDPIYFLLKYLEICMNLSPYMPPRTRHLYIYGNTSLGKTQRNAYRSW